MPHLSAALNHFQIQLPANWVNGFAPAITSDDNLNQQNVLNASVAILGVLDPISSDFFDELHLSVITGEYVSNFTAIRQELDNIEYYLTALAGNFDIPGFPNMTAVGQEVLSEGFLKPIRDCINRYRFLIDFVERHIKYQPGTNTIFHAFRNENSVSKDMASSAQSGAKLFLTNVELAEIDHSLRFKKITFQDLLLIKHDLSNHTNANAISDLLLKKCGFLLYKLTFRLQQKKVTYDYGIDFNYSSVNLIEIPEFSEWNDLVKGHYDIGMNPAQYDQFLRIALNEFEKAAPSLNLLQYHILTKFFKDSSKDIAKLRKISALFAAHYTIITAGAISDFDKKAYEITYCYIENNLLSSELEHNEFTLQNWELKFKKYTDLADNSKNSNFFPYFKIIEGFLIPNLEIQFALEKRDFKVIQNLIDKYEANLKKLIENTGICDTTDYLPFQLDFSGSKVTMNDINGIQRACFVSSSFILPLDYGQRREEHEKYRVELAKFKTMLDIQIHFRKDRQDIQNMKSDIERTDKRHIEILSIFAALVMFVSNEIQIFTKITNMADAIAYTLFFAYCLGLFVLLIWFITRPQGVRWKSFSGMHLTIILLFLSGLLYAVYYIEFRNPIQSEPEITLQKLDFKIDSLRKEKTIDSLKAKTLPKTSSLPTPKK